MKINKLIKTGALSMATILAGASFVKAQPTLTAAANGLSAALGTESTFTLFTNVYEGPAGASQTWNFDTISTTSAYTVYYASCPVGICDSFPSATFRSADLIAYSVYMNTSSSATTIYGAGSSGTFTRYTDPEESMHFPFTYNDSYADSFKNYMVFGGSSTSKEWGSDSVVADGWGTVITPIGTFTNALRIKTIRNTTDSDGLSGITHGRAVRYDWYSETLRDYVLEITHSVNGTSTSNTAYWRYATSTPSAVTNVSRSMAVRVMPNPVADELYIDLELPEAVLTIINITDVTGRIYYNSMQLLQAGTNNVPVDMRGSPAGLYLVTVAAPGMKVVRKVEKM